MNRIAAGGSQIVVETPHRGQFFFAGAGSNIAPKFSHQGVDRIIMVECQTV